MLNLLGLFSRNRGETHSVNLRAALDRVCRRFAPKASSRKSIERPPYRRKIFFENLEPRLLMSADFNPVAPIGTMIHQSNQSGNLAAPDATASYTLTLDAGQKISVVLDTDDTDLRGTVELYDTDGTSLLGSANASDPGQMALLDSVTAGSAGDYRLDVRNLAGDGAFTLDVFLNATVEIEVTGSSANNTRGTAQDLAPSVLTLPGGGLRYAAVGVTQAGEADFFSIALNQDEFLNIGLAAMQPGAGNALALELQDAAGNLLAVGDGSVTNFDQMILGYKASATGTYFLKVSGNGGEDYSLTATREALLEFEANGQPGQAQDVGAMTEVLAGLGSRDAGGAIRVAVLGGGNAVAQLNDDTYRDFTATSVTASQIDTLAELDGYDAVVLGQNENFNLMGPALRQWVEAGHGVVGTGWLAHYAGPSWGTWNADIDAVVPINLNAYPSYTYGNPTVSVSDNSHPVTDGVISFTSSNYYGYIEYSSIAADSGASVLGNVYGSPAIVVGAAGQGRGVYLAPVYPEGYWTTSMADRLLEQAVAWAAFGGADKADNYLVAASEGDSLVISTTTPGDGVSEPDNSLDPLIELFNPAGVLVASNDNDAAGDGHNALLGYTVQAGEAGQFRVSVTPVSGSGDYTLNIDGATGDTASPPQVISSSLADGIALTLAPDFVDFSFSEALDLSSVSAEDLMLDGQGAVTAATSVQVLGSNRLRFGIAGMAASDGDYALSLSGIRDLAGEEMAAAHEQTFVVDTTGPSIVDITPSSGAEPGDLVMVFTFNEGIDAGWLSSNAIELYDQLSDQSFYATQTDYDADLRRASFHFTALPEGNFDVSLWSYYIRDALGNMLGNGTDHHGSLIIDNTLGLAYPTPLVPVAPLGSLIHDSEAVGAFNGTGDVDDFSIELDAGQVLSAALFPIDAGLRGSIEIFGPHGVSLGYFEAVDIGGTAFLNSLPAADAGLYLIRVTSLAGEGGYRVGLVLNAAIEAEMYSGSANDDASSAQSLDPSVILLDGSSRAAVTGSLELPHFSGSQPMLLGTLGRGGSASTLVELDRNTGAVVRTIGSVGYSVNGLEYVAATGLLYGTVSANDSSAPGYLIQIDMDTGIGTPIGTGVGVGTVVNLTSDSAGNLFAWTESGDDLVSIDPVTGAGYVVGQSGVGTSTHGLAFDANDNLYLVDGGGEFYLVSAETGATTFQFDLNQTAHHGDFDPLTGYFFGVGNTNTTTPLVAIDVLNRNVVQYSETGEQLHTLTFTAGVGDVVSAADWYSVTLPPNELVSVVIAGGVGSQARIDLYDENQVFVATGTADATNTGQAIRDFRIPSDGLEHTYYVRVSGSIVGDYNLVVTRSTAFEREDNGSNPQDVSLTGRVLGHQDGVIDVAIFDGADGGEGGGGVAVPLLNQLNDSQSDGNVDLNLPINARQVSLADIDTIQELDQFDVVFIGASGTHYDLQSIAPMLRQWVEAGGGLIASAPIVSQAGQNYGTPLADIDAIVPVDTTPNNSNNWSYTDLTITDSSHSITQGVGNFYVEGIEVATPDAGATTLATYNGHAAVVVGNPGTGRSVFLAPFYIDSGTSLVSGDADRLVEQAVAWAAGSRVDRYNFQGTAGDTVTIYTTTPGDGTGQPENSLDPTLSLFGPDGTWLAGDTNSSSDGRNAYLTFTLVATGSYTVEVTASNGTGAYQLRVDNDFAGGAATAPAFEVVASQPYDGQIVLDYPATYRITLSEQVLLTSLDASDLTVNGVAAESVTVIDGNTLEFGIANAFDYVDQFDVAIADGALTSLSGQSVAAFNAVIDMDADTQAYPVPLAAVQPDGSLIYDPAPSALFHATGDEDDYTLEIEAGQVLTIILHTVPGVRGSISVYGPDGITELGFSSAPGSGEDAILQTVAIGETGVYTIRVRSEEGAGLYQVQALLNAAQESGLDLNGTRVDAQNIDGSFIAIGGGASRGAVRGELNADQAASEDWYSFSIDSNEPSTICWSLDDPAAGGTPQLELYNGAGDLVATGAGDSATLSRYIKDFTSSTNATFFVRVAGVTSAYTLLITRGATFDLELPSQSQDISLTNSVLGGLGSGGAGGSGTGQHIAVIATGYSAYADQGLQEIVNQLNDHTYTSFSATLITPDQADTLAELQQYDAVVVGGSRYDYAPFGTYAAALRA
ncbi:MAG: pre-peptidase C-terminal domain-containing protein, partial [Gallionella sp.]|nr:pre-peptidase C-terminal domain-containing protein [Gallionella sp.]